MNLTVSGILVSQTHLIYQRGMPISSLVTVSLSVWGLSKQFTLA